MGGILMFLLAIRLLMIVLGGYLWRMGGSNEFPKGVRRYGCPGLIMIMCLLTQNWWGLISIPFLIGVACLGYGESSTLMRILNNNKYLTRFVCGFAYSLAAIAVLWGNWWLLGFHVLLVSLGVMLAGNQKFKWEDLREEAFIGVLFVWIPILA